LCVLIFYCSGFWEIIGHARIGWSISLSGAAGADSMTATKDIDKGALRLQVRELRGTKGRVGRLGFGDREHPAHWILDMSHPYTEIPRRGYVCRRI
jgi:hypothetical protein